MQWATRRAFFCWPLLFLSILCSNIVQISAAPAAKQTQQAATIRETFDGPIANWLVGRITGGNGAITQSTSRADAGSAAELTTNANASQAFITATFSDAASAHAWQERPGTYL